MRKEGLGFAWATGYMQRKKTRKISRGQIRPVSLDREGVSFYRERNFEWDSDPSRATTFRKMNIATFCERKWN